MIKFQATNALVHYVSPVMQVSDRFQKRELILDDSRDKDGTHYSSFVIIEFTGDKMNLLDGYVPGHRVNVEGFITGREYQGRIFNSVKGLSIAPYQPQAQYTPPTAPMPGGYAQQPQYNVMPQQPQYQAPLPQQKYQQAPAYPQQYAAPAPVQPSPTPQTQYPQSMGPGADQLPFAH